MRKLVEIAVARRVTVVMTTLAVVVFGVVGYSRLLVELFPNISYPSITVRTNFPDTAPEEVEYLVTREVEEAVGVLRGLQSVHSISRSGVSEVTLEFDWSSDMDLLSLEVREKIDRLILPEEAEDPIVLRFDPALDPIIRLALVGPGELTDIRDLAERRIKPELETVDGIASAQIKGGFEEEVQIEIDQERLAALGIPLDHLRDVVGVSNVNLPGGALRGENLQYLVRTLNEFRTVEEIGELIVWRSGSATVRLREVADVRMGTKERDEITRVDGKECVEIAIYKEGDANTVHAARALEDKLENWRSKLPPGHELVTLFDQSEFISLAIRGVRDAAAIGGLLATLILFVFLRDLRSTLIVALSIPVSIIAAFLVMYRADISLNIMSLGGLTLGVGMLVDNSIVVLESIYRRRQSGETPQKAAVQGASEVGPAVLASTMTTVAVFLPIVFVEGIAGQLFRDQALTVTVSLIASLVVAVTLIPMLSAVGRRRNASSTRPVAKNPPSVRSLGFISALYDRILRSVLKHRFVTLSSAALLFVVAVVAAGRTLETELIPSLTEGEFYFEVNLPEGASLQATDRAISNLERLAQADQRIERIYSTVGSRLVAGGISLNTKAENLGQLNIVLHDRSDEAAEDGVVRYLSGEFQEIPDLDVKFGRPSYFSLKTPVEIILYGEDLDDLRSASLALAQRVSSMDGMTDVRSSLEAGSPEIQVKFDRDRIAATGLDMERLSNTLQSRIQGVVPTRFKQQERQIDVRIRNLEADRASLEDVQRLIVPSANGTPIRLITVANLRVGRGPAEVHRVQQQRAAVVTANLRERSLGSAIDEVEALLTNFSFPSGVSAEIAGQNRERQVSFQSLRFAIGLAIFLVYLVMASIFESFVHPFVVLFTIPLSLVGVVAALALTGTTVTVIVLIGGIMLVGIVVNNAIVLIDTINRMRRQGVERFEAVIQAGHLRLRPILMTTLTTVLGLVPMALPWGQGAELRAPLAITVASGLLLSTILTLLVIPAAYMLTPQGKDGESAALPEAQS